MWLQVICTEASGDGGLRGRLNSLENVSLLLSLSFELPLLCDVSSLICANAASCVLCLKIQLLPYVSTFLLAVALLSKFLKFICIADIVF